MSDKPTEDVTARITSQLAEGIRVSAESEIVIAGTIGSAVLMLLRRRDQVSLQAIVDELVRVRDTSREGDPALDVLTQRAAAAISCLRKLAPPGG